MKNKKFVLVFTLIIAFLFVLVTNTQAVDDNPLQIVTNNANNTTNDTTNNTVNNTDAPAPIVTTNNAETTNVANTDLPQTGIAEDTALFVFIAICVVSAIYAFIKVRNYKNV